MTDLLDATQAHDPGGKTRIRIPADWKVGALFGGPNNQYRYKLMHRWGEGPMVGWCCMNPSTADHHVLDPTVAKTARISRKLGYGGQYILNACAYRATDKMRLLEVDDPVGAQNLDTIKRTAENAALIVVAHGNLPRGLQRHADAMVDLLLKHGHALHVMRLSKSGVPWHPLYIPESVTPSPWLVPRKEAA